MPRHKIMLENRVCAYRVCAYRVCAHRVLPTASAIPARQDVQIRFVFPHRPGTLNSHATFCRFRSSRLTTCCFLLGRSCTVLRVSRHQIQAEPCHLDPASWHAFNAMLEAAALQIDICRFPNRSAMMHDGCTGRPRAPGTSSVVGWAFTPGNALVCTSASTNPMLF